MRSSAPRALAQPHTLQAYQWYLHFSTTNKPQPLRKFTPPLKSLKPRPQPGRILSLHNVPPTATIADISATIPTIPIAEYRRSVDSNTGQPSEVVFLLFPTKDQAVRAFFGLDEAVLLDQTIRVTVRNGVGFKSRHVCLRDIGGG
jgi:hypothetical protein